MYSSEFYNNTIQSDLRLFIMLGLIEYKIQIIVIWYRICLANILLTALIFLQISVLSAICKYFSIFTQKLF